MEKDSKSENKQNNQGSALKAGIQTEKNIAKAVNNWISQYRENRLAEKAFSDERITAWKIIQS